jgi:WD40 repeat protein
MNRHQGEVSCVGMDAKNRYMFSGGDDGKTFAIDIHNGKLAFTLPMHIDTINDIVSSPNGNWIATASYDKNISLFNIATMTPKLKLRLHDSPVMKLKFIANNRLVSVDKNSVVFIWSVLGAKILANLQGVHDDVSQITLSKDNKFLFLGTSLGHIIVYDLKTYELIARSYVKQSSAITALEFNGWNNQLIVATANGDLCFYNIYEGEEYLKELLSQKKYDEIQKQSEINPFLAYTKIYELVSNLWEKTLAQAKLYLEKSDKKTALKLLNNFKDVPAKNSIIQKTMLEYADFDKFLFFAKQEKYPLAYGLANTHPMYKESKVY